MSFDNSNFPGDNRGEVKRDSPNTANVAYPPTFDPTMAPAYPMDQLILLQVRGLEAKLAVALPALHYIRDSHGGANALIERAKEALIEIGQMEV